MKLKSILTASVLGLALGSMAHADVGNVIRFTGSTAYRDATHSAIVHAFDKNTTVLAGKSGDSANSIFNGMISGTATTIVCNWTGSEQAIKSLANQSDVSNKLSFLSTTILTGTGTGVAAIGVTTAYPPVIPAIADATVATYAVDKQYPDAGMSDTFQASSRYKTAAGKYDQLKGAGTDTVDGVIGVVMFKWIATPGTPFSNITAQQIKKIYMNGGYTDVAQITGTATTPFSTQYVYGTGRDFMSGTRLTAFAETGVGATAGVTQYFPYDGNSVMVSATGVTVASLASLDDSLSTSGYSSGGKLAAALSNAAPAGYYLIGYAGTGDTDKTGTGIAAGAKELSYNGVLLTGTAGAPSSDYTKVANGQYTFWGYEHLYYAKSLSDAGKLTPINRIATQLRAGNGNAGNSAVNADALHPWLNEMNCSRDTDGSPVKLSVTDNSTY